MTTSATTLAAVKKLPGVLAFQRGILNTDAVLFSEEDGELKPLPVVRHGIRGTQNVLEAKPSTTREVSNVQVTESARLSPEASALVAKFGVRMLPLNQAMSSCAGKNRDEVATFKASLADFIERAANSEGLVEVARRYARNVLNGRWLWRNRTIASVIHVTVSRGGKVIAEVDALTIPTGKFGEYSDAEKAVADALVDGMLGSREAGLDVTARLQFGMTGSIEVFPSQNYISDKAKGFARSLYKLGHPDAQDSPLDLREMGQAALRDQKVANALRTIDTWYPEYENVGLPIAVEPLGASLGEQAFFREKKNTSFDMFRRLAQIDPNSPDGMFCIAALIRGGVYSESDKAEKKDAKDAQADAGAAGSSDAPEAE